MRQYPRRVENYTTPFLVTVGVLVFFGLFVLAALHGFAPVLAVASSAWMGLNLVEARRRSRARQPCSD